MKNNSNTPKVKKPIYKRFWFIMIAIYLIFAAFITFNAINHNKSSSNNASSKTTTSTSESEKTIASSELPSESSSENYSESTPELSSESSTSFEETGIDKIYTKSPDSSQEATLDELTNSSFSEKYPYKGSKMNSILGVIQPWTSTDKTWYKKVEAVIVNEFGAKRNVNLEIHVTPTGSNTGTVDFIDY